MWGPEECEQLRMIIGATKVPAMQAYNALISSNFDAQVAIMIIQEQQLVQSLAETAARLVPRSRQQQSTPQQSHSLPSERTLEDINYSEAPQTVGDPLVFDAIFQPESTNVVDITEVRKFLFPGQNLNSSVNNEVSCSAGPGGPHPEDVYPGNMYPGTTDAGISYPFAHPDSIYSIPPYPGNPYIGGVYPGAIYPGTPVPGIVYQGNVYPGAPVYSGPPYAGTIYPGVSYPGCSYPSVNDASYANPTTPNPTSSNPTPIHPPNVNPTPSDSTPPNPASFKVKSVWPPVLKPSNVPVVYSRVPVYAEHRVRPVSLEENNNRPGLRIYDRKNKGLLDVKAAIRFFRPDDDPYIMVEEERRDENASPNSGGRSLPMTGRGEQQRSSSPNRNTLFPYPYPQPQSNLMQNPNGFIRPPPNSNNPGPRYPIGVHLPMPMVNNSGHVPVYMVREDSRMRFPVPGPFPILQVPPPGFGARFPSERGQIRPSGRTTNTNRP